MLHFFLKYKNWAGEKGLVTEYRTIQIKAIQSALQGHRHTLEIDYYICLICKTKQTNEPISS